MFVSNRTVPIAVADQYAVCGFDNLRQDALNGIWRAVVIAFRTFAGIRASEDTENAAFVSPVMETFRWWRGQSFSSIGAIKVRLCCVGSLVEEPVFDERANVGDVVNVEARVYRVNCFVSHGLGAAACVRLKPGDVRLITWWWKLEILLHPVFDDDPCQ